MWTIHTVESRGLAPFYYLKNTDGKTGDGYFDTKEEARKVCNKLNNKLHIL